jgi:hypothetical protein
LARGPKFLAISTGCLAARASISAMASGSAIGQVRPIVAVPA